MPGPSNDPWARREAWRYTGPFTRLNRFKGALPGFGVGAGAFAVYLVYDFVTSRGSHDSHH